MKKLLSVLLSVVMVFSVMTPLSAFAGVEKITSTEALAINNQVASDIKSELDYLKLAPALSKAYDSYIVAKAGGNVDNFVAEAEASLKANSKLLVEEKEDALTYAAAIVIFNQKGKDITAIKTLFENLADKTVANPYYYRIIVEACSVIKNTELAKTYIDEMNKSYTLTKGFDYWGFSCDNTAVYLTTIAPYKTEYSVYALDALKVLSSYKTAKGCFSNAEYGTDANADSTALAIMAYSAMGDYDQAYYYYKCLVNNFESKKNNGVMLAQNWTTGVMEENAYATKDALISLPYFDASKIEHNVENNICIICGMNFLEGSEYIAEGFCGENANWALDAEGTLLIFGQGSMADYNNSNLPWSEYISKIEKVVITNGITTIGDYSFFKCENLVSVEISNSVINIGDYSFYNCYSLSKLTMGKSIKVIGSRAFYSCRNLSFIYYSGTLDDWNSISISSNNDSLFYANFYYHEHILIEEIHSPTCMYEGYTIYKCSDCDYVKIDNYVNALGHRYICTTIQPTHLVDGYIVYTCSRCSDTYTSYPNELKATGHISSEKVIENRIDATCIEDGFYDEVVYCFVCNEELNRVHKTAVKLGHNYISETTQPTHLVDGYIVYTCSRCSDTYTTYPNELKATGHISSEKVIENRIDATCIEDGSYDEVVYCSVCNEELNRVHKTAVKLDHSFINYVSDDNYTCTEDGTKTAKCDRCDETDTIADVGSANHRYSVISSKAPSCESKGMIIYQCSGCGNKKFETPGALGHIEVNDKNYVAPTCTESGLTESTSCSRCKKILVPQEIIPELGHKEVTLEGYEPSCWCNGLTDCIICDRCGEIFEESTKIKPLGHEYTLCEVVPPSCFYEGFTVFNCTRCYDSYFTKFKKPLGHCFGVYEYDNNATCTVDGTKTAKCIRCDKTYTLLDLNHLAGHKYEFLDSTATCTEDGFDVYICSICDDIDYIEVKAGHKFVCEIVDGELQYTCSVCGEVENKTAEEIKTFWNDDFVNLTPVMGEDSAYLDVNNDGIINAKDYIIVRRC